MTRMLGQKDRSQSEEHTLLGNSASPVVRHAIGFQASGRPRDAALLIVQVYDLAMLNCQVFGRERMEKFLERSNQLLERFEPESAEKYDVSPEKHEPGWSRTMDADAPLLDVFLRPA